MIHKLLCLTMMALGFSSFSQVTMSAIEASKTILVSDIKTTHLLFEDDISYLDVGSPYFVADTLKAIIKVRHTGEDVFNPISVESNLTIITKNGSYYSIPIRYNRDVKTLSFAITDTDQQIREMTERRERKEELEWEINRFAKELEFLAPNVLIKNKNEDFGITVNGIFYRKDYLALRLELRNDSGIDIDVDQVVSRLKLREKISTDYVYQERVIVPVKVIDQIGKIKGYNTKTMVMIFKKFTPNKNERLFIDVLEANGGRSARIVIPRKKLLTPKVVYK
ncbi:DUF4138 domain-containing protein [Aggregatimonas sangjinii]|uniref:DUF4138 domain-containing protein n=1 Tax=Aggregatimonas sangjinii TaxID=2583587 RepID=A0A5B7SQ58_9FLAO|nr:DUF4138 domain-containing protein [Aggregatimonas sangjinii]QCX00667.1 DUF4138 domain-containing protein [Aggregatimonas sangjinii]